MQEGTSFNMTATTVLPNPCGALGLVLAGGRGSRLHPLTKGRTKAAVPFAGGYRLVDFVLSNFSNSGVRSIGVLTQFDNEPLLQHVNQNWCVPGAGRKGRLVTALPEQVHRGELWYQGTADAVYQNRDFIESSGASDTAVFGADHVYRMDVSQMLDFHRLNGAAATVSALPVPVDEAKRFGTIEVDSRWRVVGFHEKVAHPPEIPGRPGWALASMGNYIFHTATLLDELQADSARADSANDFGHDVLPAMISRHRVFAYDFRTNTVSGEPPAHGGYWRDVGTIPAYYEANMEALPSSPRIGLLNPHWPMNVCQSRLAPSDTRASGIAESNILHSSGCQFDHANVVDSVLGRNVKIGPGAEVSGSILMDGCEIGAGARVRRTIVDEGACVPPRCEVGVRGGASLYYVNRSGVSLVGEPN